MKQIAAMYFAGAINRGLAEKRWTPTTLLSKANMLSQSEEALSPRSLQYYLSGQILPGIERTVIIAEALEMPDLIDKRIQIERDRLIKRAN